ncbi:MAG: EamA family transporter [Pseudomonadota bacterium]
MSILALTLLLTAAGIHAGWNALLKSDEDRLRSIAILAVCSALAALPLTLAVPVPSKGSWPYLFGSSAIQVCYCFALVRAYGHGDLVSVYPIARGSAPVFVTIGAAIFAREFPDMLGLLGIALVSGGILTLSLGRSRPTAKAITAALTTGLFIASYTLVDGIGVRLSGNALGYAVWQATIAGFLITAAYCLIRKRPPTISLDRAGAMLALAGILSAVAYGISVWAMSIAAMGEVSALRETSILFAAVFAAVILKERITWQKLLGICAVTAGVGCVSIG